MKQLTIQFGGSRTKDQSARLLFPDRTHLASFYYQLCPLHHSESKSLHLHWPSARLISHPRYGYVPGDVNCELDAVRHALEPSCENSYLPMPTGQNPAMGGSIVKGEHDAPRGWKAICERCRLRALFHHNHNGCFNQKMLIFKSKHVKRYPHHFKSPSHWPPWLSPWLSAAHCTATLCSQRPGLPTLQETPQSRLHICGSTF